MATDQEPIAVKSINPKQRARSWLGITPIIISSLALIVSGVSAFYASRQAHTASDTAKRQLRPYVNLESAGDITKRSYLATFRAGQKIRVQVNFDNTGQTPAYAIRFEVDTKVLPLPLPKNFDYPTSVTTEQGITGPHSTLFTTVTSENEIGSKEYDDVENTRSAVYVYGRVGYEDAFNRKHWTEFCKWYGKFNNYSASNLCDKHNDSDRD